MAVVGILTMFNALPDDLVPFMRFVLIVAAAGVAAFALITAQMATAMAQVLLGSDEHRLALKLSIACALLCGLVSLAGVHLGWAVLSNHPEDLPPWWAVDLGGLGLMFVKPAQAFVIEACRAVERDRLNALHAADAERQDKAAERRAKLESDALERRRLEAAKNDTPPSSIVRLSDVRPKPHKGRRVVAAVMTGAAALTGAHGAAAVQPPQIEQAAQRPPEHRRPSMDEIDTAREALHARGQTPSYRTVAEHLCVRLCDVRAVWPKGKSFAIQV